jgi:stage V sporulation protein B
VARQGQFARDSLGIFAAQIAVMLMGVGTSVITARTLGPSGRGLFALLVNFPPLVSNFAKLGIPQATVYCIRRRGSAASAVASNSLWLALGLGGILAAVCYLARGWLLAAPLRGVPPVTVPIVLLLLPFVMVQTFFLGILQAEQRFREYNFQQIAPTAFGLIGMVVALLWLHLGLIGAVLVQTGVVALVTIWLVVRVHGRTPLRLGFDRAVAREMVTFGGKSYVQTLAATLHRTIDQYMINFFLGPAPVGLYVVAVNLTNLLMKIPDATGTVLYPRLASLADGDAHAATSRVCRHTLFITTALGLGYLLVGPFAIRLLYGARFEGAIRPMLIMLPGIVMMSLYMILTRNFTSRNRQGVNIVAAALALSVNFGLNCFLIPRWGISGAALATAISYSLAALLLLVMFVRESGHSVAETVLVGRDEVRGYVRRARGLVPRAVE